MAHKISNYCVYYIVRCYNGYSLTCIHADVLCLYEGNTVDMASQNYSRSCVNKESTLSIITIWTCSRNFKKFRHFFARVIPVCCILFVVVIASIRIIILQCNTVNREWWAPQLRSDITPIPIWGVGALQTRSVICCNHFTPILGWSSPHQCSWQY